MNKILKGLICIGLCSTFALTGLFGCGKSDTTGSTNSGGTGSGDDIGDGSSGTGSGDDIGDGSSSTDNGVSEHRDSETQPLKLAIGAVDGKFNPLFYTSANDGVIANQTQISLMTADENGNLAYGEDRAVVALNYKETYYSDRAGTVETGTGDGKTVTGTSSSSGATKYEIVIKNGIKFSDGVDLTIMDVLFNMYVYLDPIYSGSATMYSTKIQGLQAYRQQDKNADEDTSINSSTYYATAQTIFDSIEKWANQESGASIDGGMDNANVQKIKELYKEELTSDWSSIETSWEEAYKQYRFTEAWQVFYYIEGIIEDQTTKNSNGSTIKRFEDLDGDGEKDDGELYYTTLDADTNGTVDAQGLIDEMAAATTSDKIQAYIAANPGVSEESAKLALQKEYAINYAYESRTSTRSGIAYILNYCATSTNFLDYLVSEAMSADTTDGDLEVSSIRGIKVYKLEAGTEFNGTTYTEDHDVLSIQINGVDPKAKWNFSFAVTPMHYYSDEEHTNAAMQDYADGKIYDGTATHFGVKYKDNTWFNDVLGAGSKTSLPMGAGAYKCTDHSLNGSAPSDGGDFFYNYIANYERNEYFTTVGSGIENAKIKYLTYQVTSDDKIVESLKTGAIDYGTPTATANNQKEVNTGNLKSITYQTGGYGYIGINPKYVPDIEVRQAIMYSFNTASIITYYGSSLVNLINRPVSMTSWAYPTGADRYYEMTEEVLDGQSEVDFLRDLISQSEGYRYDSTKNQIVARSGGAQLELTFTIAGESTDHPSYNMLVESAALLEEVGMKINVETNVQALQKLATGDLAVWAAAWQSSIDPDPYQIYSIYSNASSTKNWYKDGIINSSTSQFATEREIANELSNLIDEGRQTLNQADRKVTYEKCYKLIMDLAVEFPTYQRNDLCVYNSAVIDESTIRTNATYNMGPIDEIWKVAYKK